MGAGYTDDLQLDRRDPTIGYTRTNCRWVTKAKNVKLALSGLSPEIGEALVTFASKRGMSPLQVMELALQQFLSLPSEGVGPSTGGDAKLCPLLISHLPHTAEPPQI